MSGFFGAVSPIFVRLSWTKPPRSDERHLRQRGDNWRCYRRVPKKCKRYNDRGTIRLSLGTTSVETARIGRDELAAADDAYWASLALAGVGDRACRGLAFQRYDAARTAALAPGFHYRPLDQLVSERDVGDVAHSELG